MLVARVTSDIETLAQFASWGAVSWVVNSTMIVVALGVLALYSWQLALVVFLVLIPVLPIMKSVQKRQLRAYDDLRTKVGDTLSEISEMVGGIRVIRAYGNVPEARRRLQERIQTAVQEPAAWPGSSSPSCSPCRTCSAAWPWPRWWAWACGGGRGGAWRRERWWPACS